MAKFNITVDLDWISEDGQIDEIVKTEIIDSIVNKFNKSISEEIIKKAEEEISKKIDSVINEKVNEITEQLLNRRFDLTDDWGDIKRKNVTVIELLKEKLDNFLSEKVDENGQTNSYRANITRLSYIINKNIDYTMKQKVDEAAKEIKKGLEKYIEDTLKAQIGENVAKLIGINKITSKLND